MHRVNLSQLADVTQCNRVELASASEFQGLFSGCDVGAMPPFGRLWGIPMLASEALVDDDQIAFNAGNHTEIMILSLRDWLRVVEPRLLSFSEPVRSPFATS